MTTFSDRVLLRWVPISTLLAAGTTVGLTVGPRPFGYRAWPRPAVERPIESVVQPPARVEPMILADRRLAIRGLATGGQHRPLPPVPASVTGTSSPVGPSHALPAAAAPPSSPRSGTSQAGGAAGPPRPGGGVSRGHGSGAATTATKGDTSGRPAIAAKLNVDDRGATHMAVSVRATAASPQIDPAPRPDETVVTPAAVPVAQTAPPSPTAPAPQADESAPSGD
ncbi:MAG: hypothetical protein E6G53_13745 [Actinobacteria bacterium]|nr:MAG: hypothetical protein E6G53_13745 [Actinomycetota bacterium]